MGIGLFESKEYVSELGGKLEVTSSLLNGTVFCVALPLYTELRAVKAVHME
jgi:signal transduction histidine kinase